MDERERHISGAAPDDAAAAGPDAPQGHTDPVTEPHPVSEPAPGPDPIFDPGSHPGPDPDSISDSGRGTDLDSGSAGTPWRERPGVWWTLLVLAVVGALTVVALLVATIAFFASSRPDDDPATPAQPSPTLLTPSPSPSPTAEEPATPGAPTETPEEPAPSPTDLPTTPEDLAGGETWLPDIDVQTAQLRRDGIDLRDVHLVGRGARLGTDGTIRAQEFEMEATVPFATVEAQVGSGIRLSPTDDGLVRATLPLSFFGRTLDLSVDASVHAEGDRIAFQPVRTPAGANDDNGVFEGLFERVGAIRQDVPDLPNGASIDRVAVTPDGFHVQASGQDVVLTP